VNVVDHSKCVHVIPDDDQKIMVETCSITILCKV
jgi:hypothetical protein